LNSFGSFEPCGSWQVLQSMTAALMF
jgi:hypothetical protein